MVDYPPFNIHTDSGIGPYLFEKIQENLQDYEIKIGFLPAKRLAEFFKQGKIKYIFHAPSPFEGTNLKNILILPMVKLVEKYAYIKQESLRVSEPILGFFQGDSEEKNFIGTDKFKRVEIASPASMVSMLENGRLHFINCLIPMCTYLSKDRTKLMYLTKPKGLQESLGGLMVFKKNISMDKKEIQALQFAFRKVISSSTFKKDSTDYLETLNMKYDDIFPSTFPTNSFISLDSKLIFKF